MRIENDVETCVLLCRENIEGRKMVSVTYEPTDEEIVPHLSPSSTYAELKQWIEEKYHTHPEEMRSAASRGYGRAWQKARKKYLEVHPLCVECMKEGRYVRATDVDHIIPHRGDQKLFWDESNWQALCHRHHSMKTRKEDNRPEYKY